MPKPVSRNSPPLPRRRRWTLDDAQAALAAFAASGLSIRAFAKREQLNPQRLERWHRRLAPSSAPSEFEEIQSPIVAAISTRTDTIATSPQPFEIVSTTGRIVRVPDRFDRDALRAILAIVDEVRAC